MLPAPKPLDFVPAAVLFDMDGLMIDSERAVLACWRSAASEFDVVFDEALLLSLVGLHEKLCMPRLREHHPDADIDGISARTDELYAAAVERGLPLKPGIFPLLHWLDAIKLPKTVATSTKRHRAEQKLTQTGLAAYFGAFVAGDDVENPKPAPDIYLKAATLLGVAPQDCVVLEDSEPGVRAALAAGMTPIQIPDLLLPGPAMHALGHRIVASLDDAHQLLRSVQAK